MPSRSSTGCPGSIADSGWNRWPWSGFGLQRAREIWDASPSRSRVVVAVLDDGFDLAHPALQDNLWQMRGRPNVHGWNIVNGNGDPSPGPELRVSNHGTMVAGIIGGRPEPAASFAGVAPNAALMLVRWRSHRPGQEYANPLHLAAALRFAVNHGAQIVNLSAGITTTWQSARALAELSRAFKLAETRHVLVVVAAPNTPQDMDSATDWLPGVYPFSNLIHVTGLCRQLRLLGAWGKKSVDLAAPAEDIMGPTVGGGYKSGCATSFAAPLVTGALALLWGLFPNLQADQVRHLILRNAKSTADQDSGAATPSSTAAKEGRAALEYQLGPHEVWGHEFPARPQGRLDLEFVQNAWECYRASKNYAGCFPAGMRGDSWERVPIAP